MRAVVAVMLVLICGAARADDRPVPDLRDPEMISAGDKLFREKHCSHCHGAHGNGGVNLTNRDLEDPKYVYQAIAEGREKNGIRMPAWGEVLSEREIWEATAFVMSISHGKK